MTAPDHNGSDHRSSEGRQRADYHRLLDACLDARAEPLDDPQLVALLEAHPELLEQFAREMEQLRALRSLPTTDGDRERTNTPTTGRHSARLLLAIAAGTAAGLLAWWLPGLGDASRPRPPRILSASLVELKPAIGAATSYTVHESLLRSGRAVLETYERRTEPR